MSHLIPNVTSRTPQGERTVDLYSRLLADRIIYLGTPIDAGVANTVIAQLIHLESDKPDAPIDLYINSPGGSTPATLGVYDAMGHISAPVRTTCVGEAGPTAALLLAAGEPGFRRILPHARVLLHQPASEGRRGSIPDLIVEAEELARVRRQLESILAAHTGRTAEKVRADTERDLVLTADAAVEYGLVDAILQPR
ncbi:ATP-dependent Clp protease proteolytic subunit [soil metagenome]